MSDDMTAVGASDGDDAEDAALLAELRQITALLDPVPSEAIAAARSAFAWRTIDAELAELTADTLVDVQLVGVRSAATPTMLTFESAGLTVELEVTTLAGGRRIMGQLVPTGAGAVEVRHKGGTVTVDADEIGRFSVDGVDAGPVSLRCTAGGRAVETDWFLA